MYKFNLSLSNPIVILLPIKSEPLVSVLITNYNYENFIGQAIDSVLKQTYQKFEVIICDDGSTDNSIKTIECFLELDNRIRLVTKQNGGQASALNAAFSASKGDIICILDADDLFHHEKLISVVNTFKNTNCGVVLHYLKVVDREGNVIWHNTGEAKKGWMAKEILSGTQSSLQFGSAISLRREVAERCFPLPEIFKSDADRVLGTRALLISELETIPIDLATFRIHGSNITSYSMLKLGDELQNTLSRIKKVCDDYLDFFENNYGIKLSSETRHYIYTKSISVTVLEHSLISYKQLPIEYLKLIDNKRIKIIYKALFLLPRKVSVKIYTWWRSSSKLKEIIRKLYKIFINLYVRHRRHLQP